MPEPRFQFSLAVLMLSVTAVAVIAWGVSPSPAWDLKIVMVAGAFVFIKLALDTKGGERAAMVGLATSMAFGAVVLQWSPELRHWPHFESASKGVVAGSTILAVLIYWILFGRKAHRPPEA